MSPVSAKGAKAKGTAAESAFRDHLRACGIRAERIPAGAEARHFLRHITTTKDTPR